MPRVMGAITMRLSVCKDFSAKEVNRLSVADIGGTLSVSSGIWFLDAWLSALSTTSSCGKMG